MRLRPHQYVLLVAVIALGIFDAVRIYHVRHEQQAMSVHLQRGTSPAWLSFENAAALRDAPDAQFQPALHTLTVGLDNANAVAVPPQTSAAELTELHGCLTWLLFYRQEFLHPSARAGWRGQTLGHVQACAASHRDSAQ